MERKTLLSPNTSGPAAPWCSLTHCACVDERKGCVRRDNSPLSTYNFQAIGASVAHSHGEYCFLPYGPRGLSFRATSVQFQGAATKPRWYLKHLADNELSSCMISMTVDTDLPLVVVATRAHADHRFKRCLSSLSLATVGADSISFGS
jgi:hypothetical protein